MVESTSPGTDEKIRSATVKYRNSNENIDRYINRSTLKLVLIHGANDLETTDDLFSACNYLHVLFNKIHQNWSADNRCGSVM